jgi:putative FmdB family regulatory protein
MPIYEYLCADAARGCDYCRNGFEQMRKLADPPLETCPRCAAPVAKVFSAPSIGASKSGFDARAKSAGFHKLQRLGHGEYEKKY